MQEGNTTPINGTWVAQCDDFTGGYPKEDYSGYVIGTNGSLFGPMGSLRVSVRELCCIMQMFCIDREKKNGIVYVIAGTGSDKNQYFGRYSAFCGWEESLLTAGADFACFAY